MASFLGKKKCNLGDCHRLFILCFGLSVSCPPSPLLRDSKSPATPCFHQYLLFEPSFRVSTVALAMGSLFLYHSCLNLRTKLPSYTTSFKICFLHHSRKQKFTIITPPRGTFSFIKDRDFH